MIVNYIEDRGYGLFISHRCLKTVFLSPESLYVGYLSYFMLIAFSNSHVFIYNLELLGYEAYMLGKRKRDGLIAVCDHFVVEQ